VPIGSSAPPPPVGHVALAARLWPRRADEAADFLRGTALTGLGAAILTLSARINVPLPLVSITLQTLVVSLLCAAYGARWGRAAALARLAEGAPGLPHGSRCCEGLAGRRGAVRCLNTARERARRDDVARDSAVGRWPARVTR
jgi:biotin transport system substrate-specific component